jgi:flagellar biosynthesis component FlhA
MLQYFFVEFLPLATVPSLLLLIRMLMVTDGAARMQEVHSMRCSASVSVGKSFMFLR